MITLPAVADLIDLMKSIAFSFRPYLSQIPMAGKVKTNRVAVL